MNPPMRMFILLAVFWGAGSLLLAAESPPTPAPKPAAAAKESESKPKNPDPGAAADKKAQSEDKSEDKSDAKTDTEQAGKGSIADQAEAALKAAAEADPGGAAKEPPKSDEQDAKDDTQVKPTGSAAKAPSPQRFTPTEQVRADFDVSFPIDI